LPNTDRETILLVGQNLFFLGRVDTLSQPLGYDAQRASTESAFWENYGGRKPALILIDLEGDESTWSKVLESINHREPGGAKVIAFGPHENVDMMQRAKDLGCDLVLNKGEFNRDLPKIIERLRADAGQLGLGAPSS
jgi:CheY-like chemotaxis protein